MAVSFPTRLFTKPWMALIPFALVFGYGMVGSLHYPLHDFANSYFAAYLFLHGPWDLSIFDPGKFNQAVYDAGFHSQFLSFNPFPPSTALFFAPIVYFPPFVAKGIWNFIGMGFFTFSLFRLAKQLNISSISLAIIPLIFWKPILNNLMYGQSYLVLVALMAEGYIANLNKRFWQSALCWSLAVFIKLFPVVVLLYWVTRKEWKAIAYFGLTVVLFFAMCVLTQGAEVWVYFTTQVLSKSIAGQVTLPYTIQYQSFVTFFQVVFVKNALHNPSPLLDAPLLGWYFTQLVKIIVLISTIVVIIKSKSPEGFGFFALFLLLYLPYGSTYSLVLLVFTYLGFATALTFKTRWITLLLLFWISNVGIHHFHFLPTWCQFPRLFGMATMFGLLAFIVLPKPKWYWTSLLACPFLFMPLTQYSNRLKESEWIATREHPLILYLYQKEGKLGYTHWSHNGIHFVDLNENAMNSNMLKVVNNQIFLGNVQMTTSLSQKKCPLLLKNKIVFLSDYQNGIGFYSIWSVPIH